MTVKLHLHSGFDVPRLGITLNTELGHLYSDCDNMEELHTAATQAGAKREWFQQRLFLHLPHYDLWGTPLSKAKCLFLIVTDGQFMADMETLGLLERGVSDEPR